VLKRTSIRRKNKIGATVCSFSHTLLMPTVDANDKACEFAILIQPYLWFEQNRLEICGI